VRDATGVAAGARRPRLLIVITLAEIGGAQSYVASLLPALRAEFDVVVAAHGDGPVRTAARAAGVRYAPLLHVRRAPHPVEDVRAFLEILRLIRSERPDVLHANSSKAGILGRLAATLARVPVRVFTVHGWAFRAYSGAAGLLYLWADRLLAPVTEMTICVARSDLDAGVRARTCRRGRATVIPNGVALGVPQARPRDGGPLRIVSVARLRRPKDVLTLVRAVALLPPGGARATVVGDGPQRAEVADEIRRLGVDGVDLVGERDDVPEMLAASDVFVLPTLSEGLPMSALEAMAAGLPVVAAAVGGVPELVDDGETGLLVPPGRPDALAAALGRLAADRALARRLGAAGRRRAQARFDIETCRRAHLDLYRDLIAARGRGVAGAPRRVAAAAGVRHPEGVA
jgi:glycosyltransferase involved in cell wall biosynthesis